MNLFIPDCLQFADIAVIEAGTTVFEPGDPCNRFFYLLDGSIRVDMLAKSGKEMLLYRFGAGETCALTVAGLLSTEQYSTRATVETCATVCVVKSGDFHLHIANNPQFRELVFRVFSSRIASLMIKIEEVAFDSLDARLARRLLDLTRGVNNTVEVTHEQLAQDLGSAREAVSRKLCAWERKQWLQRERGKIRVLDIERLKDLLVPSQC